MGMGPIAQDKRLIANQPHRSTPLALPSYKPELALQMTQISELRRRECSCSKLGHSHGQLKQEGNREAEAEHAN
ncbi:hypothetical protein L3X38_004794 [Prunus dulcis]|uniref:Uncharacterized protein n=1 Tax=Prunus dulcis TaxID=3755 RepID=A0AAD5F3L7_PRUDU|nr:hypothetical protein L3X38_004794 [Prunus dulcis]